MLATLDYSAPPSLEAIMTVREMMDQFDRLHLSTLKAPQSARCRLYKYFAPLAGRPFADLSILELTDWANRIRFSSPTQARGCVSLFRQMERKAREWGLYDGPERGALIPKGARNRPRTTVILQHQMPVLLYHLKQQPIMDQCYFLMLLTLFCRPGEAESVRVTDLEFYHDERRQWHGIWTKPETKTDKLHRVPIPTALATLLRLYLQTRHQQDSPWLFPGRKAEPRSKEAWWHRWAEIRSLAGLDHVTCHDLRRTGSTWAHDTTDDLVSVSKGGLNHADLKTTSIYVQTLGTKVQKMYAAHEARLMGLMQKPSLLRRMFAGRTKA